MKDAVKHRLEAILSNRQNFLLATLLGLLIALPSLSDGLFMDDYQQRATLLTTSDGNPFEFYRMGTPQTDAMLQSGVLPWWTHPVSKLVFFRPIAHWLMQLDYQLWPNNIALMHLHSVLWYAVLVAVTGLVYRRFMPSPLAAGFAAILFALDGGHGGAVAWIANRNVMVAMTGSMLALLCYQRTQWRWQFLGCLLFALTMASAEAALAITGYFFAYEVCLSRQRWPQRILRLTPYALIAMAWLAFWRYGGYGSAGPGFYTDPGADPAEFLRGLIYRAPAFLLGQIAFVPVEVVALFEESPWRVCAWIAVLLGCGLLVKVFWPLLQSSAVARFYALGMCIATLPICGSQLVGRSLWYVSFGALGLLALWLEPFISNAVESRKKLTRFACAMLVIHLVVSPILFVLGGRVGVMFDNYMDSRTVRLPNAEGSNKNVLALSVKQYEVNTYYPLLKDEALSLGTAPARAKPSISRLRLLTNAADEFELWRKDEDTLVVRRESGFSGMRKGKYGFNQGESVVLDDVTITVREITSGRAAKEIEYRFKPGVLSTYEVIAWRENHFEPAQLPAKGMKTIIKA